MGPTVTCQNLLSLIFCSFIFGRMLIRCIVAPVLVAFRTITLTGILTFGCSTQTPPKEGRPSHRPTGLNRETSGAFTLSSIKFLVLRPLNFLLSLNKLSMLSILRAPKDVLHMPINIKINCFSKHLCLIISVSIVIRRILI